MEHPFLREEMALGADALARLAQSHVAVFGIGGVGSFAAEALARSGIGRLTLVDNDTVSLTNLNRQLCALHSTLGQYKAQVMADRVRDIHPDCQVRAINRLYTEEDKADFFDVPYDYIVDAIDLVSCKLSLIALPTTWAFPSSAPWAPATSWIPPPSGRGHQPNLRLPPGAGGAAGAEGARHPPSQGPLQHRAGSHAGSSGRSPAGPPQHPRLRFLGSLLRRTTAGWRRDFGSRAYA